MRSDPRSRRRRHSTTVCGEEPLASAATATRTTPARATTYASGNHFSVQPANDWATRANPFSERDSSVADVIRPFLFPFPARCTRPVRQHVGVGRDGPVCIERAWSGTPDRMLSVGDNSRHAMWCQRIPVQSLSIDAVGALTMENCADYICNRMQKMHRRVVTARTNLGDVARAARIGVFAPRAEP